MGTPEGAKHATIDEYIKSLPKPLREVATDTRRVIDANLEGAESVDGTIGDATEARVTDAGLVMPTTHGLTSSRIRSSAPDGKGRLHHRLR